MAYTPNTDLDGLQATLGNLRLGAVDSLGVAWFLQTIEGWDSPEVRAELQDRESDHGSWFSPVYFGSRPVTLTGTVEALGRTTLQNAMDQLYAAASLTDTTLTVWDRNPTQATVRRSGKVLTQHASNRIATWSVLVTAADPRRYGVNLQTGTVGLPTSTGGLTPPLTPPLTSTAVTVSGEITAANQGTFETRPVFTITGPVTGPQIITQMPDGTIRFLIYTDSLLDGDQLVIDTDAKTCILNGSASRRRYLTVPSGWPVIPAGSETSIQFRAQSYNASALLTATWRSAWM
ncbi:phage distal tail protein [Streptomyces sp. NPDC003857]